MTLPPFESASKSVLVKSGSLFSINKAHPFIGSEIRSIGGAKSKPRSLEHRMQYLFAPSSSGALRHRRSFISSDLLNPAQPTVFIEIQGAFAVTPEIEIGCELHKPLPDRSCSIMYVQTACDVRVLSVSFRAINLTVSTMAWALAETASGVAATGRRLSRSSSPQCVNGVGQTV